MSENRPAFDARWLIAGVVLVELVQLFTLTIHPRVMIDEAWNSNTAWTLLTSGVNFDPIHSGALDRFGHEWVRRPYLGTVPWSAAFAALGLGLAQARFVSWCFGALLLGLTFHLGRKSYGAWVGGAAALLMAVDHHFVQGSHWARQDAMLAAAVLGSFVLAVRALDGARGPRHHFLAALVLGIALDVHQNALLFMPGFALLYLLAYRSQVLRRRESWAAAAGGALGIALYVATHVLPDPEAYRAIFRFNFSESHKLPILEPTQLFRSLYAELGRFGFLDDGLKLTLRCAAILALLVRPGRSDTRLLLFTGSALACFTLFAGSKHDYYAIQLVPFFSLIVAAAFARLFTELSAPGAARRFAALVLAGAVLHPALQMSQSIWERREYRYEDATEWIGATIPADARVMALPTWWLGLSDRDFTSTLNAFYESFHAGVGFTESLARYHPDALVVEAHTPSLDGAARGAGGARRPARGTRRAPRPLPPTARSLARPHRRLRPAMESVTEATPPSGSRASEPGPSKLRRALGWLVPALLLAALASLAARELRKLDHAEVSLEPVAPPARGAHLPRPTCWFAAASGT